MDAIFCASAKDVEFTTRTRTNFVAPSPSRMTSWESCCANDVIISVSALPSSDDREVMALPPAALLARKARVSLVEVSPSTLMALKERLTAWVRRG